MSAKSVNLVENANYEKVLYCIDKVLAESSSLCGCTRCRLDAVALALNMLPPHYYVALSHAKPKELGSPWILVEMAVREALERVGLSPHHVKETLEDDFAELPRVAGDGF